MKYLLLLLIIVVCGSLMPDKEPCRTFLHIQYYKNNKMVFEQSRPDILTFARMEQPLFDARTGKNIISDSISIHIIR